MIDVASFLYNYCTDFIINIANLTSTSYYVINFTVFCIVYPLLFVIGFFVLVIQRMIIKGHQ